MDIIVKDNEMKHEVVAAYNEVLRKLKVVKRGSKEEELQEEKKLMEEKKIIEEASKESPEEFIKNISDLKLSVAKSLEDIKTKLLPEYEKFYTLRQAIAFSERELDELYAIRVNFETLKTLLLTQKERSAEFETEISEKRAAFEAEINELELKRRQEEDEYLLKRDSIRKMEQEQYEAAKRDLERELNAKKIAFEEDFEARESRIAAREAEHQKMKHREAQITAREQEYRQLKEKASLYPEELRLAVQRAEQSVAEQLTRKYDYDSRLMQIELESERKLYQQKILALEEQIEQYKGLKQMFSQTAFSTPSGTDSNRESE